jgi:hypothetical protein
MSFFRNLPPGVGYLLVSTIILVSDATCLEVAGHHALANWGFFGGAVAISIAVGFADWQRPKAPRARTRR